MTSAWKPSRRPSQTCQTKGRWWNSAQCCLKNPSRSQSSRLLPAKPASASSAARRAADHAGLKASAISAASLSPVGASPLERRQADDAVLVGVTFEPVRAKRRAVHEAGAGLARPAIARETGDGDLERCAGARRVAVEQPLGRVVRMRLGQPVRIAFRRNLPPIIEIEGDLDQGCVRNVEFAINVPNGIEVFRT